MPPVTHVFRTYQEASDAIRALETKGVSADAISVVARSPRDARTLEHDTGASDDIDDSVHRGRVARLVEWLGRVESAAVPSFGGLLGTGNLWEDVRVAGDGRGAITGALVGAGVPIDDAAQLEQAVLEGAILVVIQDEDES